MAAGILDRVAEALAPTATPAGVAHGILVLTLPAEALLGVVQRLKSEFDFDMFLDVTAVDWMPQTPRFEVVLHLYSLEKGHRLRLKARVGDAEGEAVEVDSLVSVWPGANWFEREAFDMFGIVFAGHPDLRRILLYPEFEGHPLRKDYPADRVQPLVPFREGYEKQPPFDRFEGMSFGRNALPKGTVE